MPAVLAVRVEASVKIWLPLLPILPEADVRFTVEAVNIPLDSLIVPVPVVVRSIVPIVPEVAVILAAANVIEPLLIVANEKRLLFPTDEAPNVTFPALVRYTFPEVLAVRLEVAVRILFTLLPISPLVEASAMLDPVKIPLPSVTFPVPVVNAIVLLPALMLKFPRTILPPLLNAML